ncbi:transcriptional regulation of mitochondrial recombination-domain-containing protein [Thelonectria olida]|uniref:Large ribosomal subunit protein mL67 n=1 Tax=Thelonectria olida TaxID=1576542 RepID=A0A9P8W5V7_9HYPO|nr:transcriptional regulation of mitochondrial recombination-domain-containing protein [Thelonectria olida]
MNTVPAPRLGQLPSLLRIYVRHASTISRQRPRKGFQGPKGHGENIYVFTHRRSEQVIYSFEDKLDGIHSHTQIPFNGKKLKPAKIRKDYWYPFARISFPAGEGSVGRSVFQKLRELKHLHEVAWDNEFRYKRPEEYTTADKKKIAEEEKKGNAGYRPIRTKEERGIALNRQRPNSIADMAAVLSGLGAGNKMVTSLAAEGVEKGLLDVTVSWVNDQDKNYAEEWSNNVTHGLFEKPSYVLEAVEESVEEAPEVKPEAKPEA